MLRKSICTGETTAGFRDLATGKYTEVMLIRDEKDLQQFMKEYGLTERPETEY
ncbi:MAG: aspartate dehydrogenase [Eubacterium sp.]|nr:aspartate dehydrogenase [Eubacterium sp.]